MATPSRPLCLGHRGASLLAPENTAAAIRAALAAGADGIETDVRLSLDGVPFLLHDETLARTTDALARGVPAETAAETLPWQVLSWFDAGGWFSPEFAGERLLQLSELPALLPAATIDLELKPPTDHSPGHVIDAVARELAQEAWQGLLARGAVLVTSFDPELVELALEHLPTGVGLLTETVPSPGDLADLKEAGLRAVVPHHAGIDTDTVAACREVDLELWTWTVNDPLRVAELTALGVHAICTDDPGIAAAT